MLKKSEIEQKIMHHISKDNSEEEQEIVDQVMRYIEMLSYDAHFDIYFKNEFEINIGRNVYFKPPICRIKIFSKVVDKLKDSGFVVNKIYETYSGVTLILS